MHYNNWDEMFYTEEKFEVLYRISSGFNDDINSNHRSRDEEERFSSFVDAGSDALIQEHPDLVAGLI